MSEHLTLEQIILNGIYIQNVPNSTKEEGRLMITDCRIDIKNLAEYIQGYLDEIESDRDSSRWKD